MARLPRIVVPGMPHHIRHRGNRRCVVFCDDGDRKTYLRILREQCVKFALRIWAYVLMTNHVHLIAVPSTADSLGAALRNAHGDYAEYFNAKHQQSGHLWGERFKSSVLDESYLWNAIRYVERNPVRAGMVGHAEDYRWSSAPGHCGLREDTMLSSDLPMLGQIPDWAAWLRDEVPVEAMTFLRARTHTGRPCGDEAFLRRIGMQVGRDLVPGKPGPKSVDSQKDHPSLLFDEFGD